MIKVNKKGIVPWLFLALPLFFYGVWVIGPTIYTFFLSLNRWDGLSANMQWVGLANYSRLYEDPVFHLALRNNITWLVVFMVIPVCMGLGLALILNQNLKGDKLFKAAIFSPMVLAPVVIGLIWAWIYDPFDGLLNATLSAVGLSALTGGWLGDPERVLYSIIAAASWRHTGYVMLLFLAGLKTIPQEAIEAARVDGASSWQAFVHVLFPLLIPSTIIVVVITIIESLRSFDFVNIMTGGGPFNRSNVLANYMYQQSFRNYRMGYGAAISVVLFALMFFFIVLYLRRMSSKEVSY